MVQRVAVLLLLFSAYCRAQDFPDTNAIEVQYFTGNVLPHSPDLHHLVTGHPEGVMIGLARQTHGKDEWHKVYNYPDYGTYVLYQDFKNEILGKNFALGVYYNFYLLKRNLQLKVSQGIALTTNPHDNETNYKNSAFGSKFMENTNLAITYKRPQVIGNIGIEAGLMFTHFSNGRTKSPNSGINTYNLSLGVNYNFDEKPPKFKPNDTIARQKFSEPLRYTFVLRSGINESSVVGSGQRPFYHVGVFADKRINRKSAIQLGAEVFFTNSVKGFIDYYSAAYPNANLDPDTDYKRVGVFIGHELFINRFTLEVQVGYYAYQPFKYDIAIYDRFGAKYYFSKNVFAGVSVKTHGFLAEAMEYTIGVRL